jgi:hypothetical protein
MTNNMSFSHGLNPEIFSNMSSVTVLEVRSIAEHHKKALHPSTVF